MFPVTKAFDQSVEVVLFLEFTQLSRYCWGVQVRISSSSRVLSGFCVGGFTFTALRQLTSTRRCLPQDPCFCGENTQELLSRELDKSLPKPQKHPLPSAGASGAVFSQSVVGSFFSASRLLGESRENHNSLILPTSAGFLKSCLQFSFPFLKSFSCEVSGLSRLVRDLSLPPRTFLPQSLKLFKSPAPGSRHPHPFQDQTSH